MLLYLLNLLDKVASNSDFYNYYSSNIFNLANHLTGKNLTKVPEIKTPTPNATAIRCYFKSRSSIPANSPPKKIIKY